MTSNQNNEMETAMTVVAGDNIRELLKSGNIDEIQKVVQEGESAFAGINDCFSWSKGQIIGKYEILRKIGKGGMGVIYLARHTQLDTLRALKVLARDNSGGEGAFVERFIREARIASQIRHPNVVEVMDVETDPQLNVSYIVMEYVDGGSLRQVLRAQYKLNLEQAIVTIQAVAAALNMAAERKIVHRDIKPDNIMFTKEGGVKLADLGIAKKDDEEDNLTKTNVMMGTPAYLSPEQVENPKAVDIRSDIYSLGATFYEMVTGQIPYPGKTSYDILRKIFSSPVPDPRSINPEIPAEIAAIIMKMLAKEPEKRFQTPAQLLDALGKLIPALSDTDIKLVVNSIIASRNDTGVGQVSSNSVLTGTLYGMRKQEKRKKILLAAGGAAVFLAVCIGVGAIFAAGSGGGKEKVPEGSGKSLPVAPAAENKERYSLTIVTTPEATLRLISAGGQIFTYAVNSSGRFTLPGVEKGTYEVEISCPDHVTLKKRCSIEDNVSLTLLLKKDVKKISLTGEAGTSVTLNTPEGREMTFSIPESGKLEIRDLKKGRYSLKASLSDCFPVEKELTLDGDLKLRLSMEKIFKKFTLMTLPGSRVELLQNSQVKYSGKSDVEGKCLFPKVIKGVYELKITALYHAPHTSVLNLEKDASATIPLQRQRYSVTVYAATGTKGELFANWKKIREFEIPASGYFTVENLDQGKYVFSFNRKGYIAARRELTVRENTSLQINLAAVEVKEPETPVSASQVSAPMKRMGTLNIYVTTAAPQEFLTFIQKSGLEVKIGGDEWITVKTFPFIRHLAEGETNISFRGRGVVPQSGLTVTVTPERTADFLLEVKPLSAAVMFGSNRFNTLFTLDGNVCKAGEKITIEPFREYLAEARSGKQVLKRKIRSSVPGELKQVDFRFERIVHPMQQQYEKGMALFRKKEYKKALETLLPAARAKHPEAILQVAEIYGKGIGMWFSDSSSAYKWYQEAAEQGNPAAALKVAEAIRREDHKGSAADMMKYYLLALENENGELAYKISNLYKNGFKEMKADDALALKYLQKAADLEFAEAMYDLGIRHEKGQGVPFNSKKAFYWLKKAAQKGHDHARRYLEQIQQ